jgi:hypothetical protein
MARRPAWTPRLCASERLQGFAQNLNSTEVGKVCLAEDWLGVRDDFRNGLVTAA